MLNLVTHLAGGTTGPNSFSGPLGEKLPACETLPVVSFAPIPAGWTSEMKKTQDLSSDQRYLFEICEAVSLGKCTADLANKKPGPLSHSRWLTLACRMLRLYISTAEPDTKFRTLCQYIMKVYAPVWFSIRLNPNCEMGAVHLSNIIEMSRFLPEDCQKIVHSVLQRNGYFAHPENLLIAMTAGENRDIRTLAWWRIKKCRSQKSPKSIAPRSFVVPTINFKAQKYYEMITWPRRLTEPPMTRTISDQQVEENIGNAATLSTTLPCHSQAVERMVKLTSEAASKKCGQEARDVYIRAKLKSRERMPRFETKKQYVT